MSDGQIWSRISGFRKDANSKCVGLVLEGVFNWYHICIYRQSLYYWHHKKIASNCLQAKFVKSTILHQTLHIKSASLNQVWKFTFSQLLFNLTWQTWSMFVCLACYEFDNSNLIPVMIHACIRLLQNSTAKHAPRDR